MCVRVCVCVCVCVVLIICCVHEKYPGLSPLYCSGGGGCVTVYNVVVVRP